MKYLFLFNGGKKIRKFLALSSLTIFLLPILLFIPQQSRTDENKKRQFFVSDEGISDVNVIPPDIYSQYDKYDHRLLKGVKRYQLNNGLRLLVLPRKKSPTVAAFIRFKAGSVNETYRNTGTAHLLEHMLFKGTNKIGSRNWQEEKLILEKIDRQGRALDYAKLHGYSEEVKKELRKELQLLQKEHKKYVVKDAFDAIYNRNGSVGFNASTSVDVTTYKVNLPKNRLEVWAYVESERLRNPVFREFYTERDVVLEERRMRVDSKGKGMLYENFISTAFQAHPYRHPIIGWGSVIPLLSKEETMKFFRKYYAPNNMVISIVGDVDPDETYALVKKYFGRLTASVKTDEIKIQEPFQRGERRVVVTYHDSPELMIGFHKPTLPSRDDYTFDIISQLLSSGRSSHLYKELVLEKKIASSVYSSSSFPGSRFNNLFVIWASPKGKIKNEELEKAIYASIKSFLDKPISKKDLQKVKNQLLAQQILHQASNGGLASSLSYYELVADDWRYMLNHRHIVANIGEKAIKDTIRRYLRKENRTVAFLNQEGKK